MPRPGGRTQDGEVVVAAALAGAVPRQAAVPARVGDLAPKDLEEAAVRADLVATVGQQRLSILQPSNLRDGVTWETIGWD